MKNLSFLLTLLLLCACSTKEYAKINLRQDVSILPYLKDKTPLKATSYKKRFFSPWDIKSVDKKNIFWFKASFNKNYYFYNYQKIPSKFLKNLKVNTNEEDFLKVKRPAILVQNTQLYILPTKKALLKDPFKDSQGLPFNYNLSAFLNFATPLLVSHYSKDKAFAFVKAEQAWGFIDARSFVFVSPSFIKAYKKKSFVSPVKEDFSVLDKDGNFVFKARIGGIYAYDKEGKSSFKANFLGKELVFLKKDVLPFPLKFDDANVKLLIAQLLEKPYGWGGYSGERDCSSFIKDLFAPFGVYLPRNSAAQSASFPRQSLALMSDYKKLEFIKKHAKPYKTLLYMRGHIMLYVGVINKKLAVLHEVWGLKGAKTKRFFIGRLVITPLNIGINNIKIPPSRTLLRRIRAISYIN